MQWLHSQFRTFHKIHRWWKNRLTVTGRSLTLIAVVCSPAIIIPDSSLTIFFASSFFLLLLSAIVAWLHSPKLRWALVESPAWRCLEPGVVQFRVENLGRLPVFDLHLSCLSLDDSWSVEILSPHIGRLVAGESTIVRVRFTPLQRGLHRFPRLTAESLFPLGIHRQRGSRPQMENALVYPAAAQPIHHTFLEAGRSRAAGQQQLAGHSGWSGDYVGSREYYPGMPVRRWDYGSWARLGQPVVREFSNPQLPQARLLLDLSPPEAENRTNHDAIESVISVAGELSQSLIALGFQISCIQNLWEDSAEIRNSRPWTIDEMNQFLALIPPASEKPIRPPDYCDTDSPETWTLVLTCSDSTNSQHLWAKLQGTRCDLSLCLVQSGHWPKRMRELHTYQPPAIQDVLHQDGVRS